MSRRTTSVHRSPTISNVEAIGQSPLETTIRKGDREAALAAVAAGENADAAFADGLMTPLGLAVARGDADMVTVLLGLGADAARSNT
jgi:hypothetical protein